MKITSGGYEVAQSGSVLSFDASPMILYYGEGEVMHVHLARAEPGKGSDLQFNPAGIPRPDDGGDVLLLTAVDGTVGWGPASPVPITNNGEDQWFTFRVSVYGHFTSYSFEYTFFRREAIND